MEIWQHGSNGGLSSLWICWSGSVHVLVFIFASFHRFSQLNRPAKWATVKPIQSREVVVVVAVIQNQKRYSCIFVLNISIPCSTSNQIIMINEMLNVCIAD